MSFCLITKLLPRLAIGKQEPFSSPWDNLHPIQSFLAEENFRALANKPISAILGSLSSISLIIVFFAIL